MYFRGVNAKGFYLFHYSIELRILLLHPSIRLIVINKVRSRSVLPWKLISWFYHQEGVFHIIHAVCYQESVDEYVSVLLSYF